MQASGAYCAKLLPLTNSLFMMPILHQHAEGTCMLDFALVLHKTNGLDDILTQNPEIILLQNSFLQLSPCFLPLLRKD